MAETLTIIVPPNNRPPVRTAIDFPDDIRELGELIVNLSIAEAKELYDYLDMQGITI